MQLMPYSVIEQAYNGKVNDTPTTKSCNNSEVSELLSINVFQKQGKLFPSFTNSKKQNQQSSTQETLMGHFNI